MNDMSTYMANPQTVERKWYVLDAAGKPLGRVAAEAAVLLRGKHKPTFTPHVDCGDFVIVINASKAVLTGKKAQQKMHRWHTGWIGGLKEISYGKLMESNPEKVMSLAVGGMIPDTVIGRKALTRLKVYAGAEHNNAAQKPEVYEF
jgi:large subunit ribosomal protein L13